MGSSVSSYISTGSYTYTVTIPGPIDPLVVFEWSPSVPQPGILVVCKKKQNSMIPYFSDEGTDMDSNVDTIEREDVFDTVSKANTLNSC
jgi:hypothetical protein